MVANQVTEQVIAEEIMRRRDQNDPVFACVVDSFVIIVSGRAYVRVDIDGETNRQQQEIKDITLKMKNAIRENPPGNNPDAVKAICDQNNILVLCAEPLANVMVRAEHVRGRAA